MPSYITQSFDRHNPEYFYAEMALGLATLRFATEQLRAWTYHRTPAPAAYASRRPYRYLLELRPTSPMQKVVAYVN